MDPKDQVAIHEAMEQQTISITKAGVKVFTKSSFYLTCAHAASLGCKIVTLLNKTSSQALRFFSWNAVHKLRIIN